MRNTQIADGVVKLSRQQLLTRIPHGDAALLLDWATLRTGGAVSAQASFSGSEPCFDGHYRDYPVLSAAMLLELIGQAGAVLLASTTGAASHLLLAGLERLRIFTPVRPPATLLVDVQLELVRLGAYFILGRVTRHEGTLVASGRLILATGRADDR